MARPKRGRCRIASNTLSTTTLPSNRAGTVFYQALKTPIKRRQQGIGIMNIMYVSVTERTKEIGLRMSIGAKGRDILSQFLIEATLLSVAGGVIGVLLGIVAAYVVKAILNYPISISTGSIVLSFAVCTIIGIFFGWYPARKASNLDPIEALRYE